ncbi:MAG TPA: AI-2E family transporter [Tepidisphaeraceae bacterium]|jgi:predicted PurR-regulated permease PerM/methanogenic corrinoid protein MtbC1|nr:AI-2E family transporter [Tepidisphaeraceae bacterium]
MAAPALAPKSSRFLAMASSCVVIAALYFARDVLIPLAVALLLTFLLTPLVHRIERKGVPRVLAVLMVVIFSFAILTGIGWLISNQAADLAIKLGDYQGDIERKIGNVRRYMGRGALAQATRAIDQMAKDVATSQPSGNQASPSWLNRGTANNPVAVQITSAPEASSTFTTIGNALEFIAPLARSLIVIVFVIFMLIQREDIRDRVIRLVGHGKLTVTTQALDDAATRISRYLLAQSGINGAYGIVVGTALYFIHIPNAPLWGLLCALLRFIPYLGVWIAAACPIILSMVVPDGYYAARPFLTIGMFVVVELIAANVAEPLLFGSSTGLSPLAILVAAVFWTWLWGGVGLLLSTPLTVLVAVAGKYVPQLAFLDVLLGDQQVLQPPERYYQRLLADDPEEAEDLLEEFEKDHSGEEVYSLIMLPALRMTGRDYRLGVLDDHRHEFISQIMKDQVEARRRPPPQNPAPDQAPLVIPKECVVNVVCLPAHDEADEIAGLMLANLLQEQGYGVFCISAESLVSERIDRAVESKLDLVVISATPPAAAAHARHLCKRIHTKSPEIRVVIGLWNATGDLEKARKRMACAPEVRLVTKFHEALAVIRQMVQPLLIRDAEPPAPPQPAAATSKN